MKEDRLELLIGELREGLMANTRTTRNTLRWVVKEVEIETTEERPASRSPDSPLR